MSTKSTSVAHLLNQIAAQEIVLPDLQRDFVWDAEQVRLLFDSLMRGYPFGSLLFWETRFLEVSFRHFVQDFKPGTTFVPDTKRAGRPLKMVLDGQQRLQSLFLGLRGSYDGKRLYFNVTSGPGYEEENGTEADSETKFRFEFWQDDDRANRPKRLIRVADIIAWPLRQEDAEIKRVLATIPLDGEDAERAASNMRRLRAVVNQSDLVGVETIDEEASDAAQARPLREILDIFVRVNSGGTRLTRSDLMFSLIKIKWKGARVSFDQVINKADPLGTLGIDKDFIIRGALVIADVPISYDVENLERHWAEVEPKFDLLSDALKVAIDFCQEPDVGIRSAALLQPLATLFPLVYYLSHKKRCSVPDKQRKPLRTLLYFLLFNGFLRGKSPEARTRHLREVLKASDAGPVPLDGLLGVIQAKQRGHSTETTAEMLNWHPRLALNIVQPNVCRECLSWQARAEVDHIFPKSLYQEKFPEIVNDIGNFAYLGKLRNIRKDNQQPWEYFEGIGDKELDREFLIDRALLKKEKFEQFVLTRRERIVAEVKAFLGR